MSIRKRIEEAKLLLSNGYYEASLIMAVVAVAGASRKRYPLGQGLRDGEAFSKYLDERIYGALAHGTYNGGSFLGFRYKGVDKTIAEALYKEFRCNLIHEAELPDGIIIDASRESLSIDVSNDHLILSAGWIYLIIDVIINDHLILSAGWIYLIIDVIINDPNMRPSFDDIRRKAADDLLYCGSGDEDSFSKDFILRFFQSAGRLNIMKRFIATVGSEYLRNLSDDDLRVLWDGKVIKKPEEYGLDASCLTGLSSLGAGWSEIDKSAAFLHRKDIDKFTLNRAGIEMTRHLLLHYQ